MKKKLVLAGLALVASVPMLVPETAMARRHYAHRATYYRDCSGGNGAVGTIGGGVGGALIGNALGGTVGTVAGGVGGALLGRHLDKQHTRARHGCRR
ncbi:MAG: hypothetical protein KGN34_05970 [Sphingomonadales bacterium]|nr:hypothetical protein [Sphingomonadales bacterium]